MVRLKINTIIGLANLYLEPGYYSDGKFGIRIEDVVIVREVQTRHNFGDKGFLGFENVTMVRADVY